jgi:hypothetical protein
VQSVKDEYTGSLLKNIGDKELPVSCCCCVRTPSCCVWTFIVGFLCLMSYSSYLVGIANYTLTYEMQKIDLEEKWWVKTSKFPLWLGKLKRAIKI